LERLITATSQACF